MEDVKANPYRSPRAVAERRVIRLITPAVFQWRWVGVACFAHGVVASVVWGLHTIAVSFAAPSMGTPNFGPAVWFFHLTIGPAISAVVLAFLGFVCREEEQSCSIPLGTPTLIGAVPLMLLSLVLCNNNSFVSLNNSLVVGLERFAILLALAFAIAGPFLAAGLAFDHQLYKARRA
ncbi:MAG: hypothetical protein AAGJ46_17220 [Planctomycetota bacterium]